MDAYVGLLAESTLGSLGPLARDSILAQFVKIRDGDRYWFENTDHNGLTEAELATVWETSLGDVLARNSKLTAPEVQQPFKAQSGKDLQTVVIELDDSRSVCWHVTDVITFEFRMPAGKESWLAIGLGAVDGAMQNSDIYVVYRNQQGEVVLSDRSAQGWTYGLGETPALDDIQNVELSECSEESDGLLVSFERPIVIEDDNSDVTLVAGQTSQVSFAWGDGPLSYHGPNTRTFHGDILAGTVEMDGALMWRDQMKIFHGIIAL